MYHVQSESDPHIQSKNKQGERKKEVATRLGRCDGITVYQGI